MQDKPMMRQPKKKEDDSNLENPIQALLDLPPDQLTKEQQNALKEHFERMSTSPEAIPQREVVHQSTSISSWMNSNRSSVMLFHSAMGQANLVNATKEDRDAMISFALQLQENEQAHEKEVHKQATDAEVTKNKDTLGAGVKVIICSGFIAIAGFMGALYLGYPDHAYTWLGAVSVGGGGVAFYRNKKDKELPKWLTDLTKGRKED